MILHVLLLQQRGGEIVCVSEAQAEVWTLEAVIEILKRKERSLRAELVAKEAEAELQAQELQRRADRATAVLERHKHLPG